MLDHIDRLRIHTGVVKRLQSKARAVITQTVRASSAPSVGRTALVVGVADHGLNAL